MNNEQIERLAEEAALKMFPYDENAGNVEDDIDAAKRRIWKDGCIAGYTAAKEDKGGGMKWYDVSESRPENGERVLCYTIYGIQIGWLTNKGDWQFTNEGSQLSIQYWMPLPLAPDESPSPSSPVSTKVDLLREMYEYAVNEGRHWIHTPVDKEGYTNEMDESWERFKLSPEFKNLTT